MRKFHRSLCSLAALALLASGYVSPVLASGEDDPLVTQVGINFIAVLDGVEGNQVRLEEADGTVVETGTVDRFGSYLFDELAEGTMYTVRHLGTGETRDETTLIFANHPDQSFYDAQTLHAGLNYIEARDGTLLAAMVRPPLGQNLANGPFPTVVEFSGYSPADPNSPQPSMLIASAMGYATVGVNMRGSGCSGGVFDLFDLPTTADGYDLIETIGSQPWVKFGKVGMVGISFPGITQTFTAGAQPPHLGAVAPFSVIPDVYTAPGFPGGIFNDGFAKTWLQERADDARPAPEGGQGWAIRRVNEGDTVCLENQKLRLQNRDPVQVTREYPFYTPEIMDARSPVNWIENIEVPIFFSGAWQDEQVGGGWADLLTHLPKRKDVKFTGMNGTHSSPMEPETLWRWLEFLDLYVARQVPNASRMNPIAPLIYTNILGPGEPTPPVPAERFADVSDYETAKKRFENDLKFRVLLENGAGTSTPGLPGSTFELSFDRWPPRQARRTKYYLGAAGSLTRKRPARGQKDFDSYNPDSEARPMQTIPGQGQSESWEVLPDYDWRPLVDETAVGYITEPLTDDLVMVGPASINLFVRSNAADTDLQVTLSEVRPDGSELYVQTGWLRASHRHFDKRRSTSLVPVQTHLEADLADMPSGFEKFRIPMVQVAHPFRAGSRLRLTIEAPGGDRTRWSFVTYDTDGLVVNDIARSRKLASRIVLPMIRKVDIPGPVPPCPSLRGQPCRTYIPASNGG